MSRVGSHFLTIFSAALFLLSLSGCNLMTVKDKRRNQTTVHSDSDDYELKQIELHNKVAREMGYENYATLPTYEQQDVDDRIDLMRAERTVQGRREKEQYYNFKPYLKTDRERIDFIRLGDFEAREKYLQHHGMLNGPEQRSSEVAKLIRDQDISVGMTKQAVRESWGEPDAVEVAGNPMYGNERWKYSQNVATSDGFKMKKRTIIFEGGVVSGWESR